MRPSSYLLALLLLTGCPRAPEPPATPPATTPRPPRIKDVSELDLEVAYARESLRGAPRDHIPSLYDRPMAPAAQGDTELKPAESVIGIRLQGEARAYPLSVLGMHEVCNDTISGHAIAVTW